MLLSIPTASSRVYRLYGRTNLLKGGWDLLWEQAGDGSELPLIDEDEPALRFYRIGVAVPGN